MIPRYYQEESHDAFWNYLRNDIGSPLIVHPTGAGKSLVIAMMVRQAREYDARVMLLQHRKELIEQNADKIRIHVPDIEIGINSAGLRRRDTEPDVICAGIQSVYNKAELFGRRELIVIDEVHLVGEKTDSMYGQFLGDIKTINPKIRMGGLTATPFRTGEGPICGKDKMFQKICYESKTGTLIEEGFLCPITNKAATSTIDTSKIRKNKNEFIEYEMEKVFDTEDNVLSACSEIVNKCHDRHSVLCFAAGVHHAEAVAECLRELTGEDVGCVTGETTDIERSMYLNDFRNNHLRWLVNCNVLTTGFDAPCIDAIAVLRATMSPGLFCQIVGRGLRTDPSKTDCLILDFGENIRRHGSIDAPDYGRASCGNQGEKKEGEADADKNGRGKECINCKMDVAANARICPECGFQFPVKHEATADEESTLTGKEDPETWDVTRVTWNRHEKKNSPEAPPTLRVIYTCGIPGVKADLMLETFSEWVCFEHQGYARDKAESWWETRSEADMPDTVEKAIDILNQQVHRMPSQITTQKEGRWQRIIDTKFSVEIPAVDSISPVNVAAFEDDFLDDDVPF
tara:strand:- start:29326 stop:31041 length:1716 start_codon:yes stop_codon:yes gene_type:complete